MRAQSFLVSYSSSSIIHFRCVLTCYSSAAFTDNNFLFTFFLSFSTRRDYLTNSPACRRSNGLSGANRQRSYELSYGRQSSQYADALSRLNSSLPDRSFSSDAWKCSLSSSTLWTTRWNAISTTRWSVCTGSFQPVSTPISTLPDPTRDESATIQRRRRKPKLPETSSVQSKLQLLSCHPFQVMCP